MEKKKINIQFGVAAAFIFLAALTRVLPHPYNATPVGAMALFGGAYFNRRWAALLIPLAALFLSDLILDNVMYKNMFPAFTWLYSGAAWVYGSFLLIAALGWLFLKKVSLLRVAALSLTGSTLFFLVTNFSVWASGAMYPKTAAGLSACYAAGLPFYLNALPGDLLWCALLFGGYEWMRSRIPAPAYT